jgi:hypothetical protein
MRAARATRLHFKGYTYIHSSTYTPTQDRSPHCTYNKHGHSRNHNLRFYRIALKNARLPNQSRSLNIKRRTKTQNFSQSSALLLDNNFYKKSEGAHSRNVRNYVKKVGGPSIRYLSHLYQKQ